MEFLKKHLKIINVIILGISFLFVFGAFQTSAMIQTVVLNSMKIQTGGNFTGNGYTSLCIVYTTFAFSNWISPIFVVWLTPKYAMLSSAVIYGLFVASFIKPMTPVLYVGSFLVGFAAAVLWTAQGNCLSLNSNSKTISRNTAIFWILFQSSLLFGNVVQYVVFRHSENVIQTDQRIMFYTVLAVCAGVGCLLLLLIRNVKNERVLESESINERRASSNSFTPFEAFIQSFRLLKTKAMLLFFVIFAYTGIELTFFSGVYGTAVGQTKYFGTLGKGYIGLIGILMGAGEMTSSFLFNRLSTKWPRLTPDFIVLIGLIIHIVSFVLIFISLPYDSTQNPSDIPTFIVPNPVLVVFCGYLLGFGDSIFNTQIITILGDAYHGIDNPSAFALFKFIQSLFSGIAFFYSTYLNLYWQLLILVVLGICGTLTFSVVNKYTRQMIDGHNRLIAEYEELNSSDDNSSEDHSSVLKNQDDVIVIDSDKNDDCECDIEAQLRSSVRTNDSDNVQVMGSLNAECK